MKRLVIGIGNILMSDEGLGVHIARKLQEENILEENVEIIEGGTSTFDLQLYIERSEKVIIIDAIKGRNPPGTIYRLRPEDLKKEKDNISSLHQLNFLYILELVRLRGYNPEVIIFGVEPEKICLDMELSDRIKKVIPRLIREIKKEIKQ
jgi:hydrogenase maturation protease